MRGNEDSVLLLLGGKRSKELVFLLEGLEATVAELGRGIDELNLDLFGHPVASCWEERLTKDDCSLLGSKHLTSDEEVVVVDNTVEGESTKRSNVLLDGISFSSSVVGNTSNSTSTDTVDLLVDLST